MGGRELSGAAQSLALLLVWYAIGALAPRPMASLEPADPDAVVIDFHSHTEASHDGRPGFSAERNREWHRSAGFDVAYVSDHDTYEGVREALSRNPGRAGDGTVLLPAFEARDAGQHVNVLGFSAAAAYGYSPPATLPAPSGSKRPPVMLTIPAILGGVSNSGAIVAVELIDGSPRGLGFGAARRGDLVRLCYQLGAAPVAGSNNHGWGRTAPGWTILKIPGWRDLTPTSLDRAILAALSSRNSSRVLVIERAPPVIAHESIVTASLGVFVWNPFRTLAVPEQLSWLAWVWLAWWIVRRARRPVTLASPTES